MQAIWAKLAGKRVDRSHKRSRSSVIEDRRGVVDLELANNLAQLASSLSSELGDATEVAQEVGDLKNTIDQIVKALASTPHQKIACSALTTRDLTEKVGVKFGALVMEDPMVLSQLATREKISGPHMKDLYTRLRDVASHVNLTTGAEARIIIDPIILTASALLRECTGGDRALVICPELGVAGPSDDFVEVQHYSPNHSGVLRLTGQVDYGAVQYNGHDIATQMDLLRLSDDIFAVLADGTRHQHGRLMLFEAKRKQGNLLSYRAEATGKALSLMKATGRTTITFCLTNGEAWQPGCLYIDQTTGQYVSALAEPVVHLLQRGRLDERWEETVCQIVELLLHLMDRSKSLEDIYRYPT